MRVECVVRAQLLAMGPSYMGSGLRVSRVDVHDFGVEFLDLKFNAR